MSPRRSVDQELSRERILEEAAVLFAKHGYRDLTMRSIAKEMGYSHGALYYHFKDKAELFYAMVKEDFSMILAKQREMLKGSRVGDIGQLKRLMTEFIKFGIENPHHYEIMFLINDAELRKHSRVEQAQCLDLFASVVRGIIGSRKEAQHKMYTLPWSLFMSMHGFITYTIHYGQTYSEVKKMAEDHINNLCEGIGRS
ncbi:TetR/AcrR family transcriptional regulator [Paenibacillus contaminans]|uniref:TetR/AcrR family transcriptional regulator n=1 Tax=Paenibacillus contaminans TaxID=450362 RepID=A0A329MN30_9BACL|nr:TetR/AcrR family transcriptional regulator [Paenibacillus contaminans]RAV21361.1 TetR/AcrR family transcriptional regulator [Paenibacillus contaminans]